MERLEVKDMHELAAKMDAWMDGLGEYPCIGIVGFYEDIRQLMKELIILGYDIEAADLEYRELDNYDKEFLLYLSEAGISVERAWNDEFNGYFFIEGDIIAVIDDCSSAILKSIDADVELEIGIGEEDKNVHTKAHVIERDDGKTVKEEVKKDTKAAVKTECKKSNPDEDFKIAEDEEGNMHGFSISRTFGGDGYASYSYYSSNELTMDDIVRVAHLLI